MMHEIIYHCFVSFLNNLEFVNIYSVLKKKKGQHDFLLKVIKINFVSLILKVFFLIIKLEQIMNYTT